MTKRREVVRRIAREAKARELIWHLVREGANHSVYSLDGTVIPIPRHSEIDDRLAEVIFKECASKLGKDWWK